MLFIWTSLNFSFCLVAEILCGGFPLGSLVLVMEDAEAPHHMLLLRNFMSQGLVHNQPLLYASPSRDPRGFLGTLPSPGTSKDNKSRDSSAEQVFHFSLTFSILLILDLDGKIDLVEFISGEGLKDCLAI